MKVRGVWDQGEGDWLNNPVTVAVIDTGIDTDHPDLADNLWVNPGESGGGKETDGVDNDGNGYVDDVNGYSWAALNNWPYSSVGWFSLGAKTGIKSAAQAITGTGGKIKSWGTYIYIDEGTPSKNLKVYLKDSNANNKPGDTLASLTIKPSDIPRYGWEDEEDYYFYEGWVEKPFSAEVTLENGQQYFIVLETENSDRWSYYNLFYSTDPENEEDYYPGGDLYFKRDDYWQVQVKRDLIFVSDTTGTNIEDEFAIEGYSFIKGHGSSTSGIIGAVHNEVGGAGIAPGARLMTLRVGNKDATISDSAIIEAIRYAADKKAKVINMSLGSEFYSAALQAATDYARKKGAVVVASADNDGYQVENYPASNRNVISVGSMADSKHLSDFSSYNDKVDVVAPGEDIYTTNNAGGYDDNFSGTSASAPQVAGMAALLKAKNPTWGPAAISSRIINTAVKAKNNPVGSNDKYRDKYFGHGLVNFAKAFGGTNFSRIVANWGTTGSIYYDTRVRINAYLKTGNWTPATALAGVTLKGQFKPYGFPVWLTLTQGITNAAGKISTPLIAPWSNTTVRFMWDGNNNFQRAYDEFTIYVRALVHINIKRLEGKKVSIRGKVSPEHPGRTVELYRLLPGQSWKKVATGRLNRESRYEFIIKLPKGVNWYRTKFTGDADHSAGYSMRRKVIGR